MVTVEWVRCLPTVVLLLLLAVAGVLVASPASAHARWLAADPEERAALIEFGDTVVMTYSEDVARPFADATVGSPSDEPVPTTAADGWSFVQLTIGAVIVGAVVLSVLAMLTARYLRRRG